MSRISRVYLPGGRNAPAGAAPEPSGLFRRNKSLAGAPSIDGEETLDLFSSTRRGYLISSSGESDVLNRMEKKASIGFPKAGRGAADELLSVEIGKHDYDWLLTPPGTPLFSSGESTDYGLPSTSQRSSSNLKPASLVKTSRDIRQGTGGVRGASLFPHSIRSATTAASKNRTASKSDPMASAQKSGVAVYGGYANELMPKDYHESSSESREEVDKGCEVGSTMKVYGSSRYDSILLKEDSRSLNWLHGLDAKHDDHSHPFDHSRFELLPEPFILL